MGTFSKWKQQSRTRRRSPMVKASIMRRAKQALGSAAFDAPTWWRAQRDAKGIVAPEVNDDDRERWLDEQAQDYADRLSKAFGSKLPEQPRSRRTGPLDPLRAALARPCVGDEGSPTGGAGDDEGDF